MARSEQHRQRLSAALKAKWDSGTRKNGNTKEVREKIGATLKELFRTGKRTPRPMTPEQARAYRAMANPEKVAEACRKTGMAKRGVPNPPGPSAMGVGNWRAKEWRLYGPDGTPYHFVNLSEFVRTHADLFDPADVVWKGPSCRAVKRISGLRRDKPDKAFWKGWTVIARSERA